jgi:glycosyltransferase involved in cell wall biosynthesis
MLGHIGRNRLLNPVLEALAHFRGRKDWRFHIYGEIDEEPAVRLAIEDLGLETAVSVHGFTSQADLRDALTRADLAFNLRYPTLGEASYSQLTLWNYSVPTIVCDIGWYADLPRAAVYAIDPRRAVPDLARAIAAFFAEPARFAEIGRYGKQALEERHGPRRYVDRLTEFINEVNGSSGSLHAAESMARAVGHGWRGLHLPWPAQARMRDRCASVVCELAGRFD